MKRDPNTLAEEIANECKKTRTSVKHLTMMELAQRAGVSVRMIVRVEDTGDLASTIRAAWKGKPKNRQAMALARVLIQIAAALKVSPPTKWSESCELPLSSSEAAKIERNALERQRLAHAQVPLRTDRSQAAQSILKKFHILKGDKVGRLPVRGILVPYGPFAEALNDGLSFLEHVTRIALGSLDYSFDLKWKRESDYTSVLNQNTPEEKSADARQLTLVVGFLQQLQREFAYGNWKLISIPGFRVRLCFLTKDGQRLELSDILNRTRLPKKELKIVVLRDSVADVFVRGACGMRTEANRKTTLHVIDTHYEPDQIAEKVADAFAKFSGHVTFVADECTAEDIASRLAGFSVHDIAGNASLVPRYPLAIAVPEEHQFLGGFLERAVVGELIGLHSAVSTHIYAEYIAKALRCRVIGKSDSFPGYTPSYVELSDGNLPPEFRDEVAKKLERLLSDLPKTEASKLIKRICQPPTKGKLHR